MPSRQLHAIRIKLSDAEHRYAIIWPNEKREFCAKLINSKRLWLTARAGDAVQVRRDGSTETDRYFIESVSLFFLSIPSCSSD